MKEILLNRYDNDTQKEFFFFFFIIYIFFMVLTTRIAFIKRNSLTLGLGSESNIITFFAFRYMTVKYQWFPSQFSGIQICLHFTPYINKLMIIQIHVFNIPQSSYFLALPKHATKFVLSKVRCIELIESQLIFQHHFLQ